MARLSKVGIIHYTHEMYDHELRMKRMVTVAILMVIMTDLT
jgi:hypothetical protein